MKNVRYWCFFIRNQITKINLKFRNFGSKKDPTLTERTAQSKPITHSCPWDKTIYRCLTGVNC